MTALTSTMSPKLPVAALLLLLLPLVSEGQRQILGDINEQRISQVYDDDVREENIYRRPPTYLIIASKIVRPSTIYQVSTHSHRAGQNCRNLWLTSDHFRSSWRC